MLTLQELIKAKAENLVCTRIKQMVANASHNDLHAYPFNKRYSFDVPDGIAMDLIKEALDEVCRKLALEYRIGDKTMNEVKAELGIKPYRKMRSWYWVLPGTEDEKEVSNT